MGKLHTLRRAIERNPAAFFNSGVVFRANKPGDEPRFVGLRPVCYGAQYSQGQWVPAVIDDRKVRFPYQRYVRTTLRALGYDKIS
jgi:hypothetical protein